MLIPVRATPAPTDKSIPAMRITINCPMATIARREVSSRISLKFPMFRNLGALRLIIAIKETSETKRISSLFLITFSRYTKIKKDIH